MLSLLFLVPIIFAIFLLIFFKKKVVLWEYAILIFPSIIISSAIYFGMISHSQTDIEYVGDYVTTIRDYDPWDEYIQRTCYHTITIPNGKGGSTTTRIPYDCSYVDRHPRKYTQVLSDGSENEISNVEFMRLSRMWRVPIEFVDMKRDYHEVDGDMRQKLWDKNPLHSKTVTYEHSYKNKIRTSHSIFGFTHIDEEEARKLSLFDYPKLSTTDVKTLFGDFYDTNQNPILGYTPTKDELTLWQYINGYYGVTKQFRAYVLVYYNKPASIVKDQMSYWEGGNKNEMIMCFGVDSTSNLIQWFEAFSWCDKPTFEVNFRSYMNSQDSTKLDLIALGNWVEKIGVKYWERKEFKDFDYIKVELNGTQLFWLFIIILFFNIGISIYIVLNRETNDD